MPPKQRSSIIKNQDVAAATFVVGPDLAVADFAGVQQALDNLPPEGGSLALLGETFALAAGLVLPDKPVRIFGAGRGGTVIDLGVAALDAFTVPAGGTSQQQYRFEHLTFKGVDGAGQKAVVLATDVAVTFEDCEFTDVDFIVDSSTVASGVRLFECSGFTDTVFTTGVAGSSLEIGDCTLFVDGTGIAGSPALFIHDSRLNSFGAFGVTMATLSVIADSRLTVATITQTGLGKCRFEGVALSGGSLTLDLDDNVVDGCLFEDAAGTALILSGDNNVVTGCRFRACAASLVSTGEGNRVSNTSGLEQGPAAIAGVRHLLENENFRNVVTWGAKGDGVADDTVAVQAAIDSLPSFPYFGGVVFFPQGTYKVTAALVVPDGKRIIFQGSGRQATALDISATAGISLIDVAAGVSSELFFRDLTFRGDGLTAQAFLDLDAAVGVTVQECNVEAIRDVVRTEFGPDVLFENAHIDLPPLATASFWRQTLFPGEGDLTWIYVEATVPTPTTDAIVDGGDWHVTDSYIGGPGGQSAYDVQQVVWQGFRLDFANVEIHGINSRVTNLHADNTLLRLITTKAVVSNSTFNYGTATEASIRCIGVGGVGEIEVTGCGFDGAGSSPRAVSVENVTNVTITGCYFEGHTSESVLLSAGAPSSQATVVGCRFNEAGGTFTIVEGSDGCVGRYDENEGLSSGSGPAILGPESSVEGSRRKDRTAVATTDAFVDLFTLTNPKALLSYGTVKNTGVASMDVRETVLDAFGVAHSVTTAVAAGGVLVLVSPFIGLVGVAFPPFVSYTVAVKSTAVGVPTTFSSRFGAQGAVV